ncbi:MULTISPECIES: hypothetical protein [Aeromonas]|uniref:Uncharacterized protein n=1 Tax=Aeromonas veronii TaxID=654 RepID=A0A4S5CDW1_AERVE|nr:MULTISPECIES: hypothetical protein [Aeromonas]THJ43709.1 hypothetical protein E8Q35_15505 [Aeromonas veronii]
MIYPSDLFNAEAPAGSAFHDFQKFFQPSQLYKPILQRELPLTVEMLPALMCNPNVVSELGKRYRTIMPWSVMCRFIQLGGIDALLANASIADPALRSLLHEPEHLVLYHKNAQDKQLGIDLRLPERSPIEAAKLCHHLQVRVPNWEPLIKADPLAAAIYFDGVS